MGGVRRFHSGDLVSVEPDREYVWGLCEQKRKTEMVYCLQRIEKV